MDNKQFKLYITGTGSGTDVTAIVQKTVWPEICALFEKHDLKINNDASLDYAGKTTNLPAKVGAGV